MFGKRNVGAYSRFMREQPPHIVLNLDMEEPVEISNFVRTFTPLSEQYGRYIKKCITGLKSDPEVYVYVYVYVKEVRSGSIEADLIPSIMKNGSAVAIYPRGAARIVEDFVRHYGERLGLYSQGSRDETASKSDLKEFMDGLAAVANDPNGSVTVQAVDFEDGERNIRASFKFTSQQAHETFENLEDHKRALDSGSTADKSRALMRPGTRVPLKSLIG